MIGSILKKISLGIVAATAAALAAPVATLAQTAPAGSLSIMVPYPAGGLSDAIARTIGPALSKQMGGRTVLVDNLGGASGGVAALRLLGTPNDGRMIYQGSPNELILAPLVNEEVKYKPEQFRLITRITQNPLIVLVRHNLPVKNFDELVDYIRAQKDKPATYGSVGVGSMYHILTEEIASRLNLKVTHVPYRGGAPMLQDMIGGQLDFAILPYAASYKGFQDQKQMRMLTWINKAPQHFHPEIEAIANSKSLPGFEQDIWAGFFVKADTPEPVVKQLHEAISKVMTDPQAKAQIEKTGSIVPAPQSLDQASQFFADQAKLLLGWASKVDLKASK